MRLNPDGLNDYNRDRLVLLIYPTTNHAGNSLIFLKK